MASLAAVIAELERIAPLRLAADWDAVGLLVGRPEASVTRVMTCLTLSAPVAAEAVRAGADLVVTHHPLPFRPVGRITSDTAVGRVLLELISAGTAVWSSHTAWDSAAGGINDQLALRLELGHVTPLEVDADVSLAGFGRVGSAASGETVAQLAQRAITALGLRGVQIAGDPDRPAGRVGLVCGSGGDCIARVRAAGCQTFLTGEIRHHQAVEALAADLAVVAVGHHASERFALETLATRLATEVPGLVTWASQDERDPLVLFP